MDSVLGEDVTLPVGLNGSSILISHLPDGSDIDPNFGLECTVFPNASEETVSPTRVRNMKDFENQITDLKKENFNLKLRIYFLEERIQQKFDSPNEDVYKINIELKVELESLKRELLEREHLLIKASKAVESLAEGGGSEIQRVKEDARKKMQQVEDHLTRKIFHLEEDVKAAQAEVEKAFAMAEKEKVLRMSLEEKLSSLKIAQQGELEEALDEEEKDRLIEDLRLTLKKKDALIQELEEAKSQMGSPDENLSSGKLRELTAAFREEKELEIEAIQMELRNERNCFEKRILSFQEDIKEKEKEIALERKNGLKRDKTIQGLTVALKTKDKETEKLTSRIEELTTSLAKAREATHSAQIEKIKGTEDFETILLEKETLLAQLHAENRRKDTENHKLQRTIEKLSQDIDDFQHEREKLEKELDEARRQKSHGDKTINDLRNQVEKLHGEMIEKEKSVEQRYNILLSESNQKLQSQEQVMKCLTDSVNQKDILLQRLDGKIKEKDAELEQLFNRLNHLLKAKEDLELKNEDLTEKYASQQLAFKEALSSEEKQGSEYEELIHALKKEQHIYSDLVKALKDSDSINSVEAELNNIFSLRKQLEDDILSYQTLRKTLEDQINEIKRQEEESISFYSDQTSYLSICIGDHDRFQTEHLSLEELKQRVNELVMIVKALHSDNQDLRKTLFERSCLGAQESGTLAQSEILGSKEDEEDATKAEDVDEDENLLNSPQSMWGSEVTLDYSKPFCKNGYLRNQDASQLDFDVVGDSYSPRDKCQHGGEEMKLFPSPLNENRTLLLEPRPELMKAVSELLLEHLGMTEQELFGCDLEDKNEKALKQIIIQLRAELRRFKQVNKFLRQHVDLKSVFDGKERFYPAATAHLNKAIELSMVEVKDSVTQTMNSEGYTMKFKHEEKKDAAEEKPKYSVLNAEHQHENVCKMPEQQNALPLPSIIHKSTKKSRLPIPLKSSRSLGNVNLNSATQETVVYLQNQIAELHGDLKECKIQNKHLQQKLSLTEALNEEKPVQDKLLLNAEPSSKAVCQERKVELKDPEGDAGGKEEKEEDEDQRKSSGKSSDTEVSKHNELIKRASEDASIYPSLVDKPLMLPASQVLSDYEISEKSSFDSGEHKQDSEDIDKSSVVANNFSQDLLMEHLQEIRTLRRRLEESIKTNDRLRKQLEQQGGELEQGSANIFIHGSEQHNSLTSEIHFLRKQNQALNVMLARGSRDKQKENEKLRESLSRKTMIIEHLQRDYECVKQENERLQKQVSEKEKNNRHLTHAIYSSHHELNRIQAEMKVQQRQYAENAKLLQSLRVELKVYEKLEEANRRQIEPRQDMLEECRKEQNHLLDLHELLTEIQNLRVQLERSIETNNALRNKLEEQLSKGEDTMATVSPTVSPKKEWQLCPGNNVDNEPSTEDKEQCELSDHSLALPPKSEKPRVSSGGDVDSSSCCSSSSAHNIPYIPRLVPGHRMWASKSGHHVLGLIEDYNALCKQISEGQKLLSEMEVHLQAISGPKNQEAGLKVPDQAPLNGFSDSVNTAQQILEEAARLLKLLWRVSLPINGHCPVHSNQIAEMKAEIARLRKKISEQEKKLYSTARHLQLRKHQEKVIFDQLVLTHEILRKARGNLELKPGGQSLGTASSCASES
ncbi:CDK5 regulatory subunit-associated protein 2-like isoform X2 [Vombatus ursinus]|uniref:CDK5 regulatory subunit-associated protein 2-like isoform X2 n=1 Tax=Vombatus ursinus TaxID=29139 RepID=UPI000FFD497E|nr:CDK5 regulatory subunit-associated protein 2-like isoform X2 [Vombatus ursinus]XP_027723219.1 CDK5 regulatory subunit-associated protein 2-like isoform X2 [Vombatus ursinus]